MQYSLSAKEMKQCDDITIIHFGMPALVLMERAALAAAQEIILRHQIMVIEKYGFPIQSKIEIAEYDIIVDALFGIGLSREVSGPYASCIDKINKYNGQ